jgi:hypothetical protein
MVSPSASFRLPFWFIKLLGGLLSFPVFFNGLKFMHLKK